MKAYDKKIKDNMLYMSTEKSEWFRLPYTIDEHNHRRYDFPSGYTYAPTKYRNDMSGFMPKTEYHCEMCGDRIDTVYFIINPKRKWMMMVDKKCAGRFKFW